MPTQPLLDNELPSNLEPTRMPRHVAVIMDGNGRWAQNRGLPRIAGHREGVNTLKKLLRCSRDWGIQALTAYAFSTENWGRPRKEVDFLMALFEHAIYQELTEMVEEGVRIRFVGDIEALPPSLQKKIYLSVEKTQNNHDIDFTIATNYGRRQEIVHACRNLAEQVSQGKLRKDDITEELFSRYLYTADIPDPDLLIRTSGEMRISNFLLWQIAYAEIYVTNTLWPDFDISEFYIALCNYQSRERRFGKIDSNKSGDLA